jgi:hypothetical protein
MLVFCLLHCGFREIEPPFLPISRPKIAPTAIGRDQGGAGSQVVCSIVEAAYAARMVFRNLSTSSLRRVLSPESD